MRDRFYAGVTVFKKHVQSRPNPYKFSWAHTIDEKQIGIRAEMADRLAKIAIIDLPKLRDLYKSQADVKTNGISVTTIQNYIDWFAQDPNLAHVDFYCLNEDFSDGTFAVIVSGIEL